MNHNHLAFGYGAPLKLDDIASTYDGVASTYDGEETPASDLHSELEGCDYDAWLSCDPSNEDASISTPEPSSYLNNDDDLAGVLDAPAVKAELGQLEPPPLGARDHSMEVVIDSLGLMDDGVTGWDGSVEGGLASLEH